MAKGHFELLRDVFKPRIVRVWTVVVGGLYAWDALSNQVGLPKISELWGMSGNLLPWWGWLLAFQALFVYALFEYVRRNTLTEKPVPNDKLGDAFDVLTNHIAELKAEIEVAKEGKPNLREGIQSFMGVSLTHAIEYTQTLERTLSERIGAVEASLQTLGDLNNQNLDYVRKQVASLYDALTAISHLDRLRVLNGHIQEGAEQLSAPTQHGATYNQDEWEAWQAKEEVWRDDLSKWCEIASGYIAGIGTKILTATPAHYKMKGQAQSEQFPDTEAYIAYKEFCALNKNWLERRHEVEHAVARIAVNGTANERPVYPGSAWLEKPK